MTLDAKAIIDAKDLRTKVVPCPEWGGDVLLGEMGALNRARIADWLDSVENKSSEKESELKVVTCDSIEENGEFLDKEEPERPDENLPREYTCGQHVDLMLRYLSYCILDPQTYQLAFSIDQIELLGKKNRKVLERLYAEAIKLNADSQQEQEQIEKNSEMTTGGDSGLD